MGKTGTTGKTGQPPWAKRILKLLEQAKAKDPWGGGAGKGSARFPWFPNLPRSGRTLKRCGNMGLMQKQFLLLPMKAPGR